MEILDVIKNIFDIENRVFVLAIDYEVVVKGLESKYGAREKGNEREFRQYLDKIIQAPFSMPAGSYSREMGRLLKEAFKTLEIYADNAPDDKVLLKLANISKLATGGNPRSIKRLLNTLSLLQYIADVTESDLTSEQTALYLQIRFIIIALHLNFPEISRRLMENNKFTSWKLKELDTPWELKLKDRKADLEALENSSELRIYFDEDWEKTVFCLCAQTEWLKRKAWNVSRMTNMSRVTLNRLDGKDREDELATIL
ncbi:MAG: KAP family NTPase [Desulfovibrio sp.]|nr:KAP family NTPase [Desulfovibrio sp.]